MPSLMLQDNLPKTQELEKYLSDKTIILFFLSTGRSNYLQQTLVHIHCARVDPLILGIEETEKTSETLLQLLKELVQRYMFEVSLAEKSLRS